MFVSMRSAMLVVAMLLVVACRSGKGQGSSGPETRGSAPNPAPDAKCDACTGTCALGRCLVTLASAQVHPAGLAVDAKNVYWTNNGDIVFHGPRRNDGAVMKAVIDGTSPPVAIVEKLFGPFAIAVDATSVYWANGVTPTGTIMKAPLAGGVPTTIASNQDAPDRDRGRRDERLLEPHEPFVRHARPSRRLGRRRRRGHVLIGRRRYAHREGACCDQPALEGTMAAGGEPPTVPGDRSLPKAREGAACRGKAARPEERAVRAG
jgi:hypothetical protein